MGCMSREVRTTASRTRAFGELTSSTLRGVRASSEGTEPRRSPRADLSIIVKSPPRSGFFLAVAPFCCALPHKPGFPGSSRWPLRDPAGG